MSKSEQTMIQAKVFDFAIIELIRSQRESFEPLWTVDSWVKFLIWLALNCGLSGEEDALKLFAEALGPALTSRMRKIFFERTIERLSLHVMADPAEKQVLIIPIDTDLSIQSNQLEEVLTEIGLSERVSFKKELPQSHNGIIAIAWNPSENVN